MKTIKKVYLKKVKAIADWMEEFGEFYSDVQEHYDAQKEIDIYQIEVKEQFGKFCDTLCTLNEVTYKLVCMDTNLFTDDYMVIACIINMIAMLPELPSPELKCIKYLCEEYVSSFTDFDLKPNRIISSETGEVVYDFIKDTPETVLTRFISKNN